MHEPRVAFYGDDFTGSVDALLQFTRAGWRGRLVVGSRDVEALRHAAADVDVIGVAGIARSLPVDELDAEVRPVLAALAALGPRIVQYKACSTADSSPTIGNLGRVVEIARDVFGETTVPVLFAQPDFGRYTAFGHHFAAEGDRVYRLDRQPTMAGHPVTPMDESDLTRHLARQTNLPVGGVAFTEYSDAPGLARLLRDRTDAVTVLDALDDDHLAAVGRAVAELAGHTPVFAIGSGGLSTAIGAAWPAVHGTASRRASGVAGRAYEAVRGAREESERDQGYGTASAVGVGVQTAGPVLAVSGSRSPQTERQLAHAAEQGWATIALPLDVPDPAAAVRQDALAFLARGRSVAVSTSDAEVADVAGLVDLVARHLASVIEAALSAGVTRRVIVCGGDTSSHAVSLLGAESLRIAANPVGNVVLCRVSSPHPWLDGAELLLKGGQVGPVDLFELVRRLGPQASTTTP